MNQWVHLCIDMQRIFAEDTPWHVPWMSRVSGEIIELSECHPQRTIFTRFMTPERATDMPGMWRAYYEKWHEMTRAKIAIELLDVVPDLAHLIPPARILDKMTYSPWTSGHLHQQLHAESVDTVVVTGGETDVCVLAAAIGGIELGYKVIVLEDAVCSGTDETHDAALELLRSRFSAQLEITKAAEFMAQLRS
ncbi:cysteine hydrolase [Agrobacterium sp.]|jgi:nicotinamidase-related amidase|uniref:cysteine hydrolase family protein n=1 Tax=Agrobacterium sp. TaxID=361 RepID=UPI0028A98880|nr:cysteine hydrolase [Agrobacterium sp.]